jgi:hypothetical protein
MQEVCLPVKGYDAQRLHDYITFPDIIEDRLSYGNKVIMENDFEGSQDNLSDLE